MKRTHHFICCRLQRQTGFMVSLKLVMHYECIRNVSDLLINLKEIAMCCERDVLVHQTITHFAGR